MDTPGRVFQRIYTSVLLKESCFTEFVVAKKISDETSNSPLLVGGTILVAVAIALIVTLAWYFWHFGKVP